MCGRARCRLNPEQVAKACGVKHDASLPTLQMDRYRPSDNVAPGANLPVVVLRKEAEGQVAPALHCMKWGLIPSFTKKNEKPDHFRMFNARSESIREKASFRRLIPRNRCLVAVDGFYEWKKDGSRKQPYYIHFKDQRPLVFAALYDSWANSEGEILHTFTIVTTRSSSALQWLHDRMPVILGNNGSIDVWLNNSMPKFDAVLEPYEDPDLVWYPVTPEIGKLSFGGPECIKEIQLKPAANNPISKFFEKKTTVDKVQSHPEDLSSSEESSQAEKFKSQKEELAAKETEELAKDTEEGEANNNFNVSPLLKKENIESDMCGTKRELEDIATNSKLTIENMDSFPSSPVKKKGRNLKNAGDRQATLLSYFGRS